MNTPARVAVLAALTQPLTATQLATRTDAHRDQCSRIIAGLLCHALAYCVNACARRSRLYSVTSSGQHLRSQIRKILELAPAPEPPVDVDWRLYGWLCYTHRSAVVKALDRPMRPAEIKHRARFLDGSVRISASNVRDIVRLLRARGIVEPVQIKRRARPRYQLTSAGRQFRELLVRAGAEHIPCSLAERRLRQAGLGPFAGS